MLTHIKRWREAAEVHGEMSGSIRDVTVVQVVAFVEPEWLVAPAVDAVLP